MGGSMSGLTLQQLMSLCIAEKRGNNEFALFYLGPDYWSAEIGNRSEHVMLGEVQGEVRSYGKDAHEAVRNLLKRLREKAHGDAR